MPKRNRKAPEGLISGAFRLPLRTIHFILPTGIIAYALCNTLVNFLLLSSLQRVSADESENIPNSPIKVLEENISDQSLYIKYYMTIDNQKFLYIENSKIVNGDWVTNTLKTKVDENNNLIKSTKEEYQTNYHISDESIDNIDNKTLTCSKRWGH